MTYYKCLDRNGNGNFSDVRWSLPTRNADGSWTPGDWMPDTGDVIECKRGYHAAEDEQVLEWLTTRLFVLEYRDRPARFASKVAGRSARLLREITTWNETSARLFAVWCARQALARVDKPDPRSVDACDVSERYAFGNANRDELTTAWAAAWAAARATAWAAAWDAAGAAAWATAWAAAWDAARAAARAAAWDAAWAAARATAWDAAWDAARAAAWDAAWDAARDAQYHHLLDMLGEE